LRPSARAPNCHQQERFFAWIQWQRRILIRWEYHDHNFLGFVELAFILFKRF